MIDRKLQMVAAKRNGIDVTDRELTDGIGDIMKRNNMDHKQFEAALAKEGLTLEQYRVELREQMTLSRLFNKYVRTGLAVDDAEIRAFYDKNAKQYSLPEEIKVRHLVVTVPEKASPDQVKAAQEQGRGPHGAYPEGRGFRPPHPGAFRQPDGQAGRRPRLPAARPSHPGDRGSGKGP